MRVKPLIEQIANNEGDTKKALLELNEITGVVHHEEEFFEYWGWTDLETMAEIACVSVAYVSDLSKEELIEIIDLLKEATIEVLEAQQAYYEELLHKALALVDVQRYIRIEEDSEVIAEQMLLASKQSVIQL